jgi:hypothetical protein
MKEDGTRRRRGPAAPAEVRALVLKEFKWRKCIHREGDRMLLTQRTARMLLANGSIELADGDHERVFPVKRYRCSLVRP